MTTCPSCGRDNPEGFRFCGFCTASLEPSSPASAEERKIVTVLFCDLVGFTAASDEADPEDVRARLVPFHGMLRSEIERFGGTVEKFIGDAVMAVFGAPVAHEDDAERAVRSALRILEAIEELNAEKELGLKVRIGINTGEAVVTLDAHPERGEGFVTGDVVNTASRLQGVAPVGGAVVGEQTFRLTSTAIAYEALEPVEVKGKREPIPIWRVIEATARFGAETDRTDTSRFVGREDELEMLRRAFSRTLRERDPQLVVVTGEPGVGKSRLIREFFGWIDDSDELVTWRQGRCLPYGEGITFWALAEIVKAHAGIYETDPPETVATKVDEVVQTAIEFEEDRGWVSSRLGVLAGAEVTGDGGEASRDELFTAWTRFFEGISDEGPLVLVFEDLHWADLALLSFVEHLVDRATDAPVLVVATARPELRETHPEFGRDLRAVAWVPLSALSETETAELIGGILGTSALPAEAQETLVARAAGNPLFAEQFTNLLLDRQILIPKGRSFVLAEGSEIPVPANVSAIIAARLDTLPLERKRLLHDAAVVGKVFWAGAVAQLSGLDPRSVNDGLHELSRKELVRRSRRSSVEGDDEYSFWHVLTRDTAYAQIPKAERATKHIAAADWIERLAGERKPDQADLLAHHLHQAYELDVASGTATAELKLRLRLALVEAGKRLGGMTPDAALDRYRKALELAADPGDRGAILLAAGKVAHKLDVTEAMALFEDSASALHKAGRYVEEVEALVALAGMYFNVGEYERQREIERRAATVAELEGSPESDLLILSLRLQSLALGADPSRKIPGLIEELAKGFDGTPDRRDLLYTTALARWCVGDMRGLDDLRLQMSFAEEADLPGMLVNYGDVLVTCIGPSEGLRELERGIDLAIRRGAVSTIPLLRLNRAIALFDIGRWEEARQDALDLLRASSTDIELHMHAPARALLVAIQTQRGEMPKQEDLDQLMSVEFDADDPWLWLACWHTVALSWEASPDRALTVQRLTDLQVQLSELAFAFQVMFLPAFTRVCRSCGDASLVGRFLAGLEPSSVPRMRAAILATRSTQEEMHQRFEEGLAGYRGAMALYEAGDCVVELTHSKAGAGRCLVELGRDAEARDLLLDARSTFVDLGAAPFVQEVDEWLARATDKTRRNRPDLLG